jgi:hypothetical protein
MKLAPPVTAVIVGWTVVLLLIAAFISVLLNDRWQNAHALPLMFWTLYSGLVLVAIACAIGLPSEKAAFWRTWVLTLAACEIGFNAFVTDLPLPGSARSWIRLWDFRDDWAYSVLGAASGVTIATLAATVAVVLRKREVGGKGVFRFRLFHMLLLTTVVALSCWAIMNAEWRVHSYCVLVAWVVKVVAAVMLGARRGHTCFLVGFLAGNYGLALLDGQTSVIHEWLSLFGMMTEINRPLLMPDWYAVIFELMPLYAGLFTGLLAAMLYRPSLQPGAQDAQSSNV